uniref:Arginine--tRNA ligase n=1 Tax=Rhabditophanes sp. KR3021 TaxID=114890 RepID=A0AC35TYK5_9BILA
MSTEPTLKPEQEQRVLEKNLEQCTAKYQKLLKLHEDILQDKMSEDVLDRFSNLKKAVTDNEKLQYRIKTLKRSIAEQKTINETRGPQLGEKKYREAPPGTGKAEAELTKKGGNKEAAAGSSKDAKPAKPVKAFSAPQKSGKKLNYVKVIEHGDSILVQLKSIFNSVVAKQFPGVTLEVNSVVETLPKFADYQFNGAMVIQNLLKAKGQVFKPVEIAAKIKAAVPENDLIEKMEVAGPGFLNIFLKKDFIGKRIANILQNGINIPKIEKKHAVIDFSSPNIAKEMHVGHLRSTIIGESICRLLEYVGFSTLRLNHIGDWGTQFGMLIAHLQEKFPNFLNETPEVGDLQTFYKESKKRFDEDGEFKARAYECVVKLQSRDDTIIKAWTIVTDVSRRSLNKMYKRLDITLNERGESFYQDLMGKVVTELHATGKLIEEEGRKVLFPTDCSVPLTIVKSDGGYTYDTSDMAALQHRLEVEKGEWLIYVIDAGQSLHMETVFAGARDLGWYDEKEKRIEHIAFGLVLGEDGKKFKTRSGETIKLNDLLDEAVKRAADKLIEKGRNNEMSPEQMIAAQESVGYGCVKYADLSNNRNSDYTFSYDRMLEDKGNTAVYLLYAYARICSIARNVDIEKVKCTKLNLCLETGHCPLDHPSEFKLAKQIMKFSDVLLSCLDTLLPHQLCEYTYNLATVFNDFYKDCYIIQTDKDGKKEFHENRLALCKVTKIVMDSCFKIIGLNPVDKM